MGQAFLVFLTLPPRLLSHTVTARACATQSIPLFSFPPLCGLAPLVYLRVHADRRGQTDMHVYVHIRTYTYPYIRVQTDFAREQANRSRCFIFRSRLA